MHTDKDNDPFLNIVGGGLQFMGIAVAMSTICGICNFALSASAEGLPAGVAENLLTWDSFALAAGSLVLAGTLLGGYWGYDQKNRRF